MTAETKKLLFDAWQYCDDEDKSTEFMLSYMSDVANVEYDVVVDFVCNKKTHKQRVHYLKTGEIV